MNNQKENFMKTKPFALLILTSALLVVACSQGNSKSKESSEPQVSSSEPELSSSEPQVSSSQEASSSHQTSSSSAQSSLPPINRMVEKDVKVYRLFNRDNSYLDPVLDEEQYQLGSINFSFVKDEEFIPYITMENVSSLYGRFYKNKMTTQNDVKVQDDKYTWTITDNGKEIFKSTIDIKEKTFTYSGNLENYIESKKDYSKHSIFLRAKIDNSTIDLPDAHLAVVSYADTEFEVIKENNKTYFPFTMMHTFYHELTGHDFFYNYTYLYEYNESDDISKAGVSEGDKVYTPLEQMTEYIEEHIKEKDKGNKPLMPMYLRKHHRSEFTLIMNNYYGLRKTWGVSKMSEFYNVYGLYDKFIDERASVRGMAYSQAFFMLSDSHSVRTVLGDDPWIESNGDAEIDGAMRTDKTNERSLLSNALTAQREAFLKANGIEDGTIRDAVIYSKDGKTAYLGFDSFEATEKAYNNNGTVKSDDSLAKSDTFFYFVKYLAEISNHETTVEGQRVKVDNVIIDDSLNGGGYVAIMGKLIALLSKNNSSTVTYVNDLTNTVTKSVHHVDTNNDGVYDEKDCYGNRFKFYILTSPISFSCGNAFPIIAQNQLDNVRIFGTKSGGGECIVGQNYLSNGMAFVHSSNEHVIVLNETKKTYKGVENGVEVNGTLKYNDFYNMDEMVKCINKIV